MAYSTYLGELAYRLVLDKNAFDRGMADAQVKIKTFKKDADDSDLSLKKLAKDTGQLGASMAALGGTAAIAGAAIGGNLGDNLQVAGAGMAIFGGALATVVPGLKGLSVAIDGTVIPALIRLNAFLGPTGWIVIGLAATAAAVGTFIYMNERAKESLNKYSLSAEDAKNNMEGLNDALKEKNRLEKEMAGLPATKEELEFERVGALIDERQAMENIGRLAKEGATGTTVDQAAYSYLVAKRRREKIDAQIAGLGAIEPALKTATQEVSGYQAAGALNVPYEQTKQFYIGSAPARGNVYLTNNIQVQDAKQVKTITQDSITLADSMNQKGMI